jgi:hypothetical protein
LLRTSGSTVSVRRRAIQLGGRGDLGVERAQAHVQAGLVEDLLQARTFCR